MAKPLSRKLRDAFYYRVWRRLVAVWDRIRGRLRSREAPAGDELETQPVRLHVGCGRHAFEGWVNTDIQAYPEVDLVLDITQGIPHRRLERVYSEHFLEHLDVEAAIAFLVECNEKLVSDGWLRLSTPNLDWVWTYVYSPEAGGDRLLRGIHANRSFYGWRHRFLWNRELLEAALHAAGFAEIRWCEYGVSELPEFRGRERHETYPDHEGCPHVLIVEARRGAHDPGELAALRRTLQSEFHDHMAD